MQKSWETHKTNPMLLTINACQTLIIDSYKVYEYILEKLGKLGHEKMWIQLTILIMNQTRYKQRISCFSSHSVLHIYTNCFL